MRFTEIVAPCGLLYDIHFEIVNTVEALAFLVFAQMQRCISLTKDLEKTTVNLLFSITLQGQLCWWTN